MAEEQRVLVVDDEDVITWAISHGLTRPGEIEVETAASGEEALEVMKAASFDLVITDIRMKGMTGFELLGHIRTLYPETGVVVMTAYGSVEAKREANERGSLFYLDKTFEMDEMRQVVRDALEQVGRTRALKEQQGEGFSGEISNLSLVDMVQLHCLARNTALMEVSAPNRAGVIGFEEGEVVSASTEDGLAGTDAFLDMLSWTGGQFETLNRTPAERNIEDSWESLLLEASDVISDAAARGAGSAEAPERALTDDQPAATDIHTILEDIAVEQGVMAAFVAGDSGVVIDGVTTTFEGDAEVVGELARTFQVVDRVRAEVEPDATQNRTILQFDRTRVLSLEVGETAVYLMIISGPTGQLPHLLQLMAVASKQLERFV